MNIKISGYKKTKESFLSKVSKISSDINTLKDNLTQLNIFSTILPYKNKLTVIENKNKISIKSEGKDKNTLNINLPNIFGMGERVDININSLKEYEMTLAKPFIFNNSLVHYFLNSTRSIKKILDKEYTVNKKEVGIRSKYLDLGYGLDKYIFINWNHPIFKINLKQGLDYAKLTSSLSLKYNLIKNIQYKLILSTGSALGNITPLDRFYLGENIKGYKKNSIIPSKEENKGGRSFLEMTNKLIFNMMNMDFYIFNSMCCNNAGQNILKYQYLTDIINKSNNNQMNNNQMNYGHSIGFGLKIPIYSKDLQPNIDISLAYPIIKYSDTETYEFGFEVNF